VVERSGDETLVLDVAASRVHRLNSDGLAIMDATVNGPCDVGPGLHDAAGELVDAGVLHTDSWSRRRFIGRTVGAAIVATVLLPTATAAASTEPLFVGPEVSLFNVFRTESSEVQRWIRADWAPVAYEGRDISYRINFYANGLSSEPITTGTEFPFFEFYAEDKDSWTVFVEPWYFDAGTGQQFGTAGPATTITVDKTEPPVAWFEGPTVNLDQDGDEVIAEWKLVPFPGETVRYEVFRYRDYAPVPSVLADVGTALEYRFPAEGATAWSVFVRPYYLDRGINVGEDGETSNIDIFYPIPIDDPDPFADD
jgi:hypothetical protein